ncbi:MAG: preprotein translocase subunit SecG [Pseudomonadota bacterium]
MESLITVIHFAICVILILTILLQVGKGADIGAVFGGASQTLFGSRGPATFLNKMTIVLAILFLATSLTLAQMAKTRSVESVLSNKSLLEAVEKEDTRKANEKALPQESEQKSEGTK